MYMSVCAFFFRLINLSNASEVQILYLNYLGRNILFPCMLLKMNNLEDLDRLSFFKTLPM